MEGSQAAALRQAWWNYDNDNGLVTACVNVNFIEKKIDALVEAPPAGSDIDFPRLSQGECLEAYNDDLREILRATLDSEMFYLELRRYRLREEFSAGWWRHKYVAVVKYVPKYGMDWFLRLSRDYQPSLTVEFLKAQLAKDPLLLDAAIKTHAHLDVNVVNYHRGAGARIRPGKGPSMLPSSKGKLVDYEVEHTFRVVYEEDDQGYLSIPAYVEITFWGFLERRLNLVMRGWDKLRLLEEDAAAAKAAVAAALARAAPAQS